MAIYLYSCEECGEQEINHPMHSAPLTICPKCGKIGLVRKFGVGGIQFKGSGFYKTDSKPL